MVVLLQVCIRAKGKLQVVTGLVSVQEAGVLKRGKDDYMRIKLVVARLCGHGGSGCKCKIATHREFTGAEPRDEDEVEATLSGADETDDDSDDEYWKAQPAVGGAGDPEDADGQTECTLRHIRRRQRRRLAKACEQAMECPLTVAHLEGVMNALTFLNTDGASVVRSRPKVNPTAFVLPKTESGSCSKAATARIQRWMARANNRWQRGEPSCRPWAFWCPNHLLDLGLWDMLKAMFPDDHELHKLLQLLAGPIKQDSMCQMLLGKAHVDLYAAGAYDDWPSNEKDNLLSFKSFKKVRWTGLLKALEAPYKVGPTLFVLQQKHQNSQDALPLPMQRLLFSSDSGVLPLWNELVFAQICNMLDIFRPSLAVDVAGDPHAGLGGESQLVGYAALSQAFQSRKPGTVTSAAALLDGFTKNLEQTHEYLAETVVDVDEDFEETDEGNFTDNHAFDERRAKEPGGARLQAFKAKCDAFVEGDASDDAELEWEWADVWPQLTETGVRLRRAVSNRFKHLRPFHRMCALVDPRNHPDEDLPNSDPRFSLANEFAVHLGLPANTGGRMLQDLRQRLRVQKLDALDHSVLKEGLVEWYNHKADHGWNGDSSLYDFVGGVLAILFSNGVTESELSMQGNLSGGKGGKAGNLGVTNRRNLGLLRGAPNAVALAHANRSVRFEGNVLLD